MDKQKILNDSIQDLEVNNFNPGIIQDNKLVFVMNEKTYRVRMPIQSEQALCDHKRNLTQLEYLRSEGCITKKQLIRQLKENNIFNVEQVEERRDELTKELKQVWFMLATQSSEKKVAISDLKEKIATIQHELKSLAIELATQLSPSMESRLEKFTVEYLSFLCTDVLDGKEWKKVWETFEDYQKASSDLTDHCAGNLTWMLLSRG